MVIHDDDGAPTEVSLVMKQIIPDDALLLNNKNSVKKSKNASNSDRSFSDSESSSLVKISENDLLELKTVYEQCKSVLKRIEQKYSCLLDIDTSDYPGPCAKRSRLNDKSQDRNECQCSLNKKILFDEDGKEVVINTLPCNHICPNKLMLQRNQVIVMHSQTQSTNSRSQNIQIEHYRENEELPDDVQELRRILQDPNIETTHRNQVIEKLKSIKQEQYNELKLNKPSVIKELKKNPKAAVDFYGSNLVHLAGYNLF